MNANRVPVRTVSKRSVYKERNAYARGPAAFRGRLAEAVGLGHSDWVLSGASDQDAWRIGREHRKHHWSSIPWLTPVVGTGPVGVTHQFNLRAPSLGLAAAESVAALTMFDDESRHAGRGEDERDWVRQFTEQLVRTHTGITPDPRATSGLTRLTERTTYFLASAACLTRLFHRMSLDTSRPVSWWGSVNATADPDLPRYTATHREFVELADALLTECVKHLEQDGEALPFGEIDSLIEAIQDELADKKEPTVRLLHLQQLTEVAWYLLVSEAGGHAFPGWTDLLLRLVLSSEGGVESAQRRPRLSQNWTLVENIRKMYTAAGGSSEAGDTTTASQDFYDALADVLWTQSTIRSRNQQNILAAAAVSMSFDNELELALIRSARRSMPRGESRRFVVFVPVYVVQDTSDEDGWQDGTYRWLQADFHVTGEQNPGQDPLPEPEWKVVPRMGTGEQGAGNTDYDMPMIVRLAGAPLFDLPTRADPTSASRSHPLVARGVAEIEGAPQDWRLEHAITLDEYNAVLRRRLEDSKYDDGPLRLLSTANLPDAPSRFWGIFGVPLRDPAIRTRLVDMLVTVSSNSREYSPPGDGRKDTPATDDARSSSEPAPGRGRIAPDTRDRRGAVIGAGTAPPQSEAAPVTSSPVEPPRRGAVQEPRSPRRGLVVSRHIDDEERNLATDLGFDVVTNTTAADFAKDLAEYATWLHTGNETWE